MPDSLVGPPDKLRIPLDRRRFDYVGHLLDGTQFMAFVTAVFPDDVELDWDTDEWRAVKRWVAVLHLFDAGGNHLSTDVKLGGRDIEGRDVAGDKASAELGKIMASLSHLKPRFGDIYVRMFAVRVDDVTHKLHYEATQPDENGPIVEGVFLDSRDIMFHPPWHSGEYST
jgi:hypothetical protein